MVTFTQPLTVLGETGASNIRTVISGDYQLCDCVGLTPDGDPDGGDSYSDWAINAYHAQLICEALNACRAINPADSLAVAQAMPQIVEAAKGVLAAMQSRRWLCMDDPEVDALRRTLAALEPK